MSRNHKFLFYAYRFDDDQGFFSLYFDVQPITHILGDVHQGDPNNHISLRYQAHNFRHGSDSGWYAGQAMTLEAQNLAQASALMAFARKVGITEHYGDPEGLFRALSKSAHFMVMDARQSGFVLPEYVLPPEYSRWVDDYQNYNSGKGHVSASVHAVSYLEAVLLIDAALRFDCTDGPEWSRNTANVVYSNWVEANKPVRRIDYEHYPKPWTLDKLMEYQW